MAFAERARPARRRAAFPLRAAPPLAVACLAAVAFLLALPPRALANPQQPTFSDVGELDLGDLLGKIVTASKHEQTLAETPAAVTVFGARDIERFGWRTLADLLREVPGFYVSYDRVYSYLGVRGFSRPGDFNSRVLVLLDGHTMQEGWYGSAGIGYEGGFDLTGVRRVEIVRGPGSVLYGTNAFFAVVNVVTMTADEVDGAGVETGGGSRGTVEGRLRASRRLGAGAEAVAIASTARSDGADLRFVEFGDGEGPGTVRDADYERAASGYAKIDAGPVALRALYGSRKKGMPTAPYEGVFGDTRNRAIDRHGFVEAVFDRSLSRATGITLIGSLDHSSYDDYIPIVVDEEGTIDVFRDDARTTWGNLSVALRVRSPERSLTTVGGEVQAKHFELDVFTEGDGIEAVTDLRNQENAALFVQNETRLSRHLQTTLGVRRESHSEFGSVTVPRAGLIAALPDGLRAKLLYGGAFRNPNLAEAFYDDGVSIAANPNLRRESVRTAELIVEGEIGAEQYVGASVYLTWVRDLIDLEATLVPELVDPEAGDDGVRLVSVNRSEVKARGVELRYEGSFRSGTRLFGGVSLGRADNDSDGDHDRLANSPTWVANVGAAHPFLHDRLTAGVTAEYVSDRLTFRDDPQTVPGHLTANLNLRYRAPAGVHVALLVRNLGDARFEDPIGEEHLPDRMRQDGRTVSVRLGYGF